MKNKLIILFLFVIGVVLAMSNGAHAQNQRESVLSGVEIIAYATDETIGFEDLNGTQMPTVEPSSDITCEASSIYGFSWVDELADETVTPGDTVSFIYLCTNEGNAGDRWLWLNTIYSQEAGAQNWLVERWVQLAFDTTLEAGIVSSKEVGWNPMGYDGQVTIEVKVVVPEDVGDAPDGSYVTILSTVETPPYYSPVGEYTGANAILYGGTWETYDLVMAQVSAPVLNLTRTSTLDAPAAYSGERHDAVPGAVVTFTITISNEGGASAEAVILIDKVPDNTKLAHVNATGNTTNVTIEAAQGNFYGWTVYYTTEASPLTTYEAPGWTLIGTTAAGGDGEFPGDGHTYLNTSPEADAVWIKWEKQYVDPADDGKTLTWGVTIR